MVEEMDIVCALGVGLSKVTEWRAIRERVRDVCDDGRRASVVAERRVEECVVTRAVRHVECMCRR